MAPSSNLIPNRRGERRGGRRKGVPNKVTTALREAILEAAEVAGGEGGIVGYLTKLATDNSSAFASLLGKVLPTTLGAEGEDGVLALTFIERRIVHVNRAEVEPNVEALRNGDKSVH